MKNVIFLDLDGVVNPIRNPKPQNLWSDYTQHVFEIVEHGMLFRVTVWQSRELLRRLDVHEIVWASTWCCYPSDLRAFALAGGVNDIGVDPTKIDLDGFDSPQDSCGKLEAVKDFVENRGVTQFVWVDDFLDVDDWDWAASINAESLLIKPQSHEGLTPADVDRIDSFFGN